MTDRTVFDRVWKWALLAGAIGTLITFVMVGYLVIARWDDSATLSDQRALQDRQDCARVISNDQSVVKDEMNIAKARLDSAFVGGILETAQDPTSRARVSAELATLQRTLDATIDKVAALPSTQKLVDRRCPSVADE